MSIFLRNWAIVFACVFVCFSCSKQELEEPLQDPSIQLDAKDTPIIGKIIQGIPTLLQEPLSYQKYFQSIYQELPQKISLVQIEKDIYLKGRYTFGSVYIHTTLDPSGNFIIIQHEHEDCLGQCDCSKMPGSSKCDCDDESYDGCVYDNGYAIF